MSRKQKFQDREYRATYAESFLDTTIATQIRVLREQRGWTQGELADYAGMKQSRISALEDANYSGWGVKTLKRLARAFDVPLNVTFGSFGRLLSEIDQFNRRALERPAFKDDPAFVATAGYQQESTTPMLIDEGGTWGRLLPFPEKPVNNTMALKDYDNASITARYERYGS
jgi:transcriptional regulator with XRE-family HTH domain